MMEKDVFSHICKYFDLQHLFICSKVCRLWYLAMKECLNTFEFKLSDVVFAKQKSAIYNRTTYQGLFIKLTSQIKVLLNQFETKRFYLYNVNGRMYFINNPRMFPKLGLQNNPDYLIDFLITRFHHFPIICVGEREPYKKYKVTTINEVSKTMLCDCGLLPKFEMSFDGLKC